MWREVRIPVQIPDGVELPLRDVDAAIPHMTQRWPKGGQPDRIELPTAREAAHKVDAVVVFRVPASPPPPEGEGVRVDWEKLRPTTAPKKRKPQE